MAAVHVAPVVGGQGGPEGSRRSGALTTSRSPITVSQHLSGPLGCAATWNVSYTAPPVSDADGALVSRRPQVRACVHTYGGARQQHRPDVEPDRREASSLAYS